MFTYRKFGNRTIGRSLLFAVILGAMVAASRSHAPGDIEISADFVGKELAASDRITLRLNAPLQANQGNLAFVLNETDLTAVFEADSQVFSYKPAVFPLPAGESKLRVYLVNSKAEWRSLAEFTLKVVPNSSEPDDSPGSAPSEKMNGVEFSPNVSLNFSGEQNIGFFPESGRPERAGYMDTAGQASFQLSVRQGGWTLSSQFDLAGSSRKQQALRFGELGENASPVDLSSYQVRIEKGRFKAELGHVSFGSQRHLINGFSSRGLLVTVPVGKQNEVSFAAMNGTSIVGFDNFIGITRANHQILSATFSREFLRERPGGLRIEVTGLSGSLLPLDGFNERTVNDSEKNGAGSVRLLFSDSSGRLRFEGGFARSRFRNPADPLVSQDQILGPIRPTTRNARFVEVSYDLLRDLNVWAGWKLKLTGTLRHEELQPLFRSVAAFNQSDRRQNQFEVTGGLGEIAFTFGNVRDRDNLRDIPSILKTRNRQYNVILSIPLNTVFTPAKPVKWLPRFGYNNIGVHQFGEFQPVDGDFNDPSQVPDQKSNSQNINLDWSLTDKVRLEYRYSRSFQDNRQPGRELADFRNSSNAVSLGLSGIKKIEFVFQLSREQAESLELSQVNSTFRFGVNFGWQDALVKNLTFNSNLSSTLAGDRANISESRNYEFDSQVAYRFEIGKEKFKKLSGQFFVRYSNRYGSRFDRVFLLSDLNKNQGVSVGLSFNFS